MDNKRSKNLLIILSVISVLFLAYNYYVNYYQKSQIEQSVSYSQFIEQVDNGSVTQVSIKNSLLKAATTEEKVLLVNIPTSDAELLPLLKEKGVEINIVGPSQSNGFSIIFWVLLIVGIFLIFRARAKKNKDSSGDSSSGGGGGIGPFGFGKSKARVYAPSESKITFADVAGVDEAKEDLQEVVDFLSNPSKFSDIGAKIPTGCLLVGNPGTGKTLLAKAVAGEAKVPFFYISGSDFVEMFVGVGASRVRDLFTNAKKNSPCIVFIDEIDAVGRQRGSGVGGGNDEREQTLNQLLVEMDGFSENQGVIVIAATNRADVLDKALLRPGRFDRQVVVPLPDIIGRERILQIYLAKIPLEADVDVNILARGTTGFSGADLSNLVNEAALWSARKGKKKVSAADFDQARDKIIMGAERKTAKMSENERKLTAYHEAGHALVAFHVPYYPVHKVTIMPRGRSLGVTAFLPERDEYSKSYTQLISELAVLFGGRISEELKFGKEHITTGASMDIQMATNVARRMIMDWGYSDKVGRIKYSKETYEVSGVSNETSRIIEEEIIKLISDAEEKAREILVKHSKAHEDLSQALLDYEVLTGEEARLVCEGKTVEEIRKTTETKVATNTDNKEELVELKEEKSKVSSTSLDLGLDIEDKKDTPKE